MKNENKNEDLARKLEMGLRYATIEIAELRQQIRETIMENLHLADAEQSLKSLPGTIVSKGRKPNKTKMKEEIMIHRRIAVKCRHEVEMFRAVIAALSEPNVRVHTPLLVVGLQ